MLINYNLTELQAVAKQVIEEMGAHKCLAFFAPMGAGKTTLIHAICAELKVIDNVSSPTYSLINEYKTEAGERVVHMDWYRLKDEDDALNAGVADYMYNDSYCFIEWPEQAVTLLPKDCKRMCIEVLDDENRSIRFLS